MRKDCYMVNQRAVNFYYMVLGRESAAAATAGPDSSTFSLHSIYRMFGQCPISITVLGHRRCLNTASGASHVHIYCPSVSSVYVTWWCTLCPFDEPLAGSLGFQAGVKIERARSCATVA